MWKVFVKSPEIGNDDIDLICERLSRLPDLYLPNALATQAGPVTQIECKDHLANLVHRDAAVFLERYGKSLNSAPLGPPLTPKAGPSHTSLSTPTCTTPSWASWRKPAIPS